MARYQIQRLANWQLIRTRLGSRRTEALALSLLLLTATWATPGSASAQAATQTTASSTHESPLTAIVGAQLIDPVAETVSRDVLILENGRITSRTAAVPEGFGGRIIDLEGRFLTPAFNDLHVHGFGNTGPTTAEILQTGGTAERMIASGVTGFLDLSNFEDVILMQRDRQRTDPSFMPGADIYSAGAAFTCPGGHGTQFPNPAREVTSPEDARRQVREVAAQAPDVIKLIYIPSNTRLPSIDKATMEAIVATAHEAQLKVVAHVDHWDDALDVVRAGAFALTHTNAAPVPEELLAEMKQRGTAIIPTLAVHLGFSWFYGHPDRLNTELMQRVSLQEFRDHYRADTAELNPRLEQRRVRQTDERDGLLRSVRTFSNAGIKVLTGSDAGNPGTFQGASLHRELAFLVEAGLTPWQALRASTTDAADLLGQEIGLNVGDLAHLAVFDASPLDDIRNTESLSLVIHHGRVVDMTALDLPIQNFRPIQNLKPPSLTTPGSHTQGSPEGVTTAEARDESPQHSTVVRGIVQGASGYALSHVEITLRKRGETNGLMTSKSTADGSFELSLSEPPESRGELELVATYPGFDPLLLAVEHQGQPLPVSVELTLQVSRFQEVLEIRALSPTDESLQPQQELDFLDIVTTAGTRADPMFATQVLPGVVKLDEGSGLFVRGGDASEVATYLDRALLDHPYRNETPSGGFFGTVDAFALQGLSLSAAGFPARYGNSLSAVLQLTTRDPSPNRSMQLGIGLASLSASLETPLGEKTGARLAINHSDLKTMTEVNDTDLDFVEPPHGTDVSLLMRHELSERSALLLSGFEQDSELGTEFENGNFLGLIDTSDANRILNTKWQRSFGRSTEADLDPWFLDLTLSHSEHESLVQAGVLDIDLTDETNRLRMDIDAPTANALWHFGGVFERTDHLSGGTLPDVGGDFGGDQGLRLWNLDTRQQRAGAYVEFDRAIGLRTGVNVGVRYDDWSLPEATAFQPRASLSVRLGTSSHLRLAWGLYNQSPEIEYFTLGADASGADLAQAEHRVISLQLRGPGDPFHVRIEGYEKIYEDLPLEDTRTQRLTGQGRGSARGIDLFFGFGRDAGGTGLLEGWRGSLAYTLLDAERLYTPWQDWQRYGQQSQTFEPDFAIPHTAQLILYKTLPLEIQTSLSARFAVGRPFTPVLGSEEGEFGLTPIYGAINSERVPDFERVDLSASRPFAMGSGTALVYVGLNDVFDRRNVFRYVYSADWSQRSPARTAFGRTWYFGVTFQR